MIDSQSIEVKERKTPSEGHLVNELVSLIDDEILEAAASMTLNEAQRKCDELVRKRLG